MLPQGRSDTHHPMRRGRLHSIGRRVSMRGQNERPYSTAGGQASLPVHHDVGREKSSKTSGDSAAGLSVRRQLWLGRSSREYGWADENDRTGSFEALNMQADWTTTPLKSCRSSKITDVETAVVTGVDKDSQVRVMYFLPVPVRLDNILQTRVFTLIVFLAIRT